MPAEADECQHKNEQRNRQQTDHFTLIAGTLSRLQFQLAILGALRIRALRLIVHNTILRRGH